MSEFNLDILLKPVLKRQPSYHIGITITEIFDNVKIIRNSKEKWNIYLC